MLFSQFGKVYDVNLFRAFQGAPTTKVRVCCVSLCVYVCVRMNEKQCVALEACGAVCKQLKARNLHSFC